MKRGRESAHDDNLDRRKRVSDNKGFGDDVNKHLRVHPISQYAGSFPFFREPKELGTYSNDGNHEFRNDNHQLRYFTPPEDLSSVEYDLQRGYNDAKIRDDGVKTYLDSLLKWLSINKDRVCSTTSAGTSLDSSLNTDFLCWRGLLTKLLCTPYENREGWIIAVTLFKGTFYMCEFDTQQKIEQRINQTEKEKEMSYWGYKFEQYVTSDHVDGRPCTDAVVNTNEQFVSLVRSRLKQHSLMYAGEVDCCEKTSHGTKYVELKTSRELYRPNNERNFKRFKLIKWWAQSFLIGIPKIIAGFRDDDGVVRRLEAFETLHIPKMIKDLRDPWDASVCFNFLDKFLHFVKGTVKEDNHRRVHLFQWTGGDNVTVEKLPEDSNYCFLRKWYIDGKPPP